MKQNYKNHVRYYIPHHFIFLPLMGFLMVLGIVKIFTADTHQLEWGLFSVLSFCILYLAIMLRQHYALGNQDRIVRLEFRLRYFELFNAPTDVIETQLSFAQIAALRFANNTEFVTLLRRAVDEKLSADEIKKAVKNWQGDYWRV